MKAIAKITNGDVKKSMGANIIVPNLDKHTLSYSSCVPIVFYFYAYEF